MMKSRKLAIGLLLMLAVVVTTGSFAYWASSVGDATSTAATASVTIGAGAAETTTLTFSGLADDGATALVPTSQGGNDTIVFTIDVSWDGVLGATGTLEEPTSLFVLAGLTDAEIDAMFSVTYSFTSAINAGDASDTVVTATLVFDTEPIDKATYDLVASQSLDLQITFDVTAD